MPTVDVERLSFVDVSEKTRGNFMQPENIDRFLASEVGKAQEKMMREQIAAQGFKPEDITTSMIRRSLFVEQASQDNGGKADITTKQLMDSHGPTWYQKLGDLVTSWGKAGKEATENAVTAGAGLVADGVTNNSGLTGQAADAIRNRGVQLDAIIGGATGPGR